jgi:hypothetical protein
LGPQGGGLVGRRKHTLHAFREASRIFERGSDDHHPAPERAPALDVAAIEPQSLSPRVLPDLVAAAREQERIETAALEDQRARRASNRGTPKPHRNRVQVGKVEEVIADLQPIYDQPQPTSATSGHAAAPAANIRGGPHTRRLDQSDGGGSAT